MLYNTAVLTAAVSSTGNFYTDPGVGNVTAEQQGAVSLAAILRDSKLPASTIDAALSAAIALGLKTPYDAVAPFDIYPILLGLLSKINNGTAQAVLENGIKQVIQQVLNPQGCSAQQ